jgi:hypothetical protein
MMKDLAFMCFGKVSRRCLWHCQPRSFSPEISALTMGPISIKFDMVEDTN